MALIDLLELLDIEEASEFEFFENFAELVESDYEFSVDDCYALFKEAPRDGVIEIIGNYFEEILDGLPDDKTDMYTLLETIKMSLMGLLQAEEDETSLVHFAEELKRFKDWYSSESRVEVRNMDDGEIDVVPIRDAIVLSRLEALEGSKYHYDFEECLEYELDEFIVSYGDAMRDYGDGDYDNSELLDSGYVYDDEMGNN